MASLAKHTYAGWLRRGELRAEMRKGNLLKDNPPCHGVGAIERAGYLTAPLWTLSFLSAGLFWKKAVFGLKTAIIIQ